MINIDTCKHDFSNEDSGFCTHGCGKKETSFIIEKLQQENARLKELAKNLDNYTTHTTQDCSVPLHKCDCGLDRLREELNP